MHAIDGWVQEDGVLLRPRRGTPSAGWVGARGWQLPAPATAPATRQASP